MRFTIPLFYLLAVLWGIPALIVECALRVVGFSRKIKPLNPLREQGLVAVVTGSNTGIGYQTAAGLAKNGVHVVLACRDMKKAEESARIIETETGGRITPMELDLADLRSVRRFAAGYMAAHDRLDILVNNAGLNSGGRTAQGLELKLGVNFLGHFELTSLLMPVLLASNRARVVNLSSVMHHFAEPTEFTEDVLTQGAAHSTYSISKLAMILFTAELNRRYRDRGLRAAACNPGAVNSDIWRHTVKNGWSGRLYSELMKLFYLNTEQGCYTSLDACLVQSEFLDTMESVPYCQPYMLPLGPSMLLPFEMCGPFVGSVWVKPRLSKTWRDEAERVWRVSTAIISTFK